MVSKAEVVTEFLGAGLVLGFCVAAWSLVLYLLAW